MPRKMKAIVRRPALKKAVRKVPVRPVPPKPPAPQRPTQSVNVNVRNIMKTAPDYIIPQRYPGGANKDMGDRIRAFSQPAMYGNPLPSFLPYQDRSAIQGQQLPQVSGPAIEQRRDVIEVEVDPADIGGKRPIPFTAIRSIPVSPFSLSQSTISNPSPVKKNFEGVPQPRTQQDLSELLVSHRMDQDTRDSYHLPALGFVSPYDHMSAFRPVAGPPPLERGTPSPITRMRENIATILTPAQPAPTLSADRRDALREQILGSDRAAQLKQQKK